MKKSSTKQPFLPLFFGDFLGATAEWDGEERSLYLLLLGYQWSLGTLPADTRKLRKLVDYQQDSFDRWWPTVSSKFERRGERLVNRRLEVHRAKTLELSGKNAASGKKGAEARWRKDSERHANDMANTKDADGERQLNANGESVANDTYICDERHESANGVMDGNPSHPIPSHPIPNPNPDISSQLDSLVAGTPAASGPGPGRAGRLRKVSNGAAKRRMPADQPTEHLRAWTVENHPGIDFDREIAKLRDHQFRDAHTDWDATIRNWMRKAEDYGRGRNGNGAHTSQPPTRYRTADELEDELIVAALRKGLSDGEIFAMEDLACAPNLPARVHAKREELQREQH